jgi:general secretion pathway protein G
MTEKFTPDHPEDGFTLVEMLAVIAIIGILGAATVFAVLPQISKSQAVTAKGDINTYKLAVTTYRQDMGRYPETLSDLVVPPRDRDLAERFPRGGFVEFLNDDPWGNEYVYVYPGEENRLFDIISYGADGEPGGEGENADIVSWKR